MPCAVTLQSAYIVVACTDAAVKVILFTYQIQRSWLLSVPHVSENSMIMILSVWNPFNSRRSPFSGI